MTLVLDFVFLNQFNSDSLDLTLTTFESVETQEDPNDVTYQPPHIISEGDKRNITLRPRRKWNEEANFIEFDVPTTYEEAINYKNSNKWKEAISEELQSLKENKTWKKSNTGYIFMMNGGPVSWASRKQNTVALSTTDSEYMAASEAVKEILWLRQLLIYIDEPQLVISLCIDNQSAIKLIHNPIYHKRTKHIDIRYNFIGENVEQNVINVQYVKSSHQLADFLTKALPSGKFILNRDQVLNINCGFRSLGAYDDNITQWTVDDNNISRSIRG
ncbi:unnamed protein product [Parnassius mnemosyne]|uniref:Copia protein n=1 Tax=Parnassius mnemosyne TaxID=213953 RepID=A0AAV1L234_9NEOP